MEIDLRQFGERLRAARQARKWTQQEVADRLGAPRTWVSDLENNQQRGLSADTVMRFARGLEVSADYLLGLTDDPRPRRQRPRKAAPVG
jgi:transcriptional regulator with XRE-family HTH domain